MKVGFSNRVIGWSVSSFTFLLSTQAASPLLAGNPASRPLAALIQACAETDLAVPIPNQEFAGDKLLTFDPRFEIFEGAENQRALKQTWDLLYVQDFDIDFRSRNAELTRQQLVKWEISLGAERPEGPNLSVFDLRMKGIFVFHLLQDQTIELLNDEPNGDKLRELQRAGFQMRNLNSIVMTLANPKNAKKILAILGFDKESPGVVRGRGANNKLTIQLPPISLARILAISSSPAIRSIRFLNPVSIERPAEPRILSAGEKPNVSHPADSDVPVQAPFEDDFSQDRRPNRHE